MGPEKTRRPTVGAANGKAGTRGKRSRLKRGAFFNAYFRSKRQLGWDERLLPRRERKGVRLWTQGIKGSMTTRPRQKGNGKGKNSSVTLQIPSYAEENNAGNDIGGEGLA